MNKPLATARFIETTYEELAQAGASNLCCSPRDLYSADELAALPEAVLALSSGCGHPLDDAEIEPGATIVDIGSGAGADCLLAARRTGPTGSVIGVDPSPAMRATAERHRDDLGLTWIDYREGTADHLPVTTGTADLVISNCVLSLSTDPGVTWAEIARILKPGGRVVVSDIVGGDHGTDVVAQAKCETGISWAAYREILLSTGFSGIRAQHARQAGFRDGTTATSVTFTARYGMPAGHAAIEILYQPTTRGDAETLLAAIGRRASEAALPVTLHLKDVQDPGYRPVVDVLREADLPLGPVSVSVDAGLVDPGSLDPDPDLAAARVIHRLECRRTTP